MGRLIPLVVAAVYFPAFLITWPWIGISHLRPRRSIPRRFLVLGRITPPRAWRFLPLLPQSFWAFVAADSSWPPLAAARGLPARLTVARRYFGAFA